MQVQAVICNNKTHCCGLSNADISKTYEDVATDVDKVLEGGHEGVVLGEIHAFVAQGWAQDAQVAHENLHAGKRSKRVQRGDYRVKARTARYCKWSMVD